MNSLEWIHINSAFPLKPRQVKGKINKAATTQRQKERPIGGTSPGINLPKIWLLAKNNIDSVRAV